MEPVIFSVVGVMADELREMIVMGRDVTGI